MITTVRNTLTLLEQRKQICADLQGITEDATSVYSEVVLTTFYASDYTHEVGYCDTSNSSLIDVIDDALGTKIVTDSYKNNSSKILAIPKKVLLNTYFTPENESKSDVVKHEQALLLACGYDLSTAYYFAVPFPPGTQQPHGVFFIFAKDDNEATLIEKNIKILLDNISRYFA